MMMLRLKTGSIPFLTNIEALATEVAKDSVPQLNIVSKDYYSNTPHIIHFCKREPIKGTITAYNLKQGIYNILYTIGEQERISHEAVLLPYCPPTKQIGDDTLLRKIKKTQYFNVNKRSWIGNLDDLVGRTFLIDVKDDGNRDSVRFKQLLEGINCFKKQVEKDSKRIELQDQEFIAKILVGALCDIALHMMETKLLCKHDWKKCKSFTMLGKQYRNRKWANARSKELDKLNEYKEFKNFGDPKEEAKYFAKYKKIQKHVIYNVNYVGRHRNRVIAGYVRKGKARLLIDYLKIPLWLAILKKDVW